MSVSECTSSSAKCKEGLQQPWVHALSSAAVFIGSIVGQFSFGYAGDSIGREEGMIMTLSIATFGAAGSACFSFGDSIYVYIVISVFRFILGVGIGGIYPLSAVKAAEDAALPNHDQFPHARDTCYEEGLPNPVLSSQKSHSSPSQPPHSPPSIASTTLHIEPSHMHSGPLVHNGPLTINVNTSVEVAKSFFWQIPGTMMPWLIGYLLTLNKSLPDTVKWKLLLGLGAVPTSIALLLSCVELYLKAPLHPHDSISLLAHSEMRLQQRKETIMAVENALKSSEYQWKLVGTGGSWFVYDIILYGLLLYGSRVISALAGMNHDNISFEARIAYISSRQLIALSVGVPSVMCTIVLLKHLHTKAAQVVSFLLISFAFFLFAGLYDFLLRTNSDAAFALYCVLYFTVIGGPNVTTYVLPSETYPVSVRSTFNGISAALGKLGAATGAAIVSMDYVLRHVVCRMDAKFCLLFHPTLFYVIVFAYCQLIVECGGVCFVRCLCSDWCHYICNVSGLQ